MAARRTNKRRSYRALAAASVESAVLLWIMAIASGKLSDVLTKMEPPVLNESPAIHFGNTRGGKRSIRIAARKRLQIGRPDQCVTQGPGRPGRSLANAFAHGVVRANQNPIGTRIDRIIVDWVSNPNRGGRPTSRCRGTQSCAPSAIDAFGKPDCRGRSRLDGEKRNNRQAQYRIFTMRPWNIITRPALAGRGAE